jgi:hypothetical protein
MLVGHRAAVLARRVVGGVGGPASYHTDRSVRVLKSKVNPNDPEFKVCVCVRVCVCVYLYGVRSVVVVTLCLLEATPVFVRVTLTRG